MPTFLNPSVGTWAVTASAQTNTVPNRAAVTVSYNPSTQPNPAIRYSDLFAMFGTVGPGGQACVFPGTALEAFVNLLGSGSATPASIAALQGSLAVTSSGGALSFAVPTDLDYFDLTAAFAGATGPITVLVYLSVPTPPQILTQGLCSSAFSIPASYLTKVNAFSGAAYSAASASVPVYWSAFAALLKNSNLAKPLISVPYATQYEFDQMQARDGFNVQFLRTDADNYLAWYFGIVAGGYILPSIATAQQEFPANLVRFTVPHSIIQ